MPPFNVGVAQVEERLRALRRRLNGCALQDGLYLGGSVIALAAALTIAADARMQGPYAAAVRWLAAGAAVTAGIAAVLRIRRRWRSLEQVVRYADDAGGLQDRLATLLFASAGRSGLSPLLLEQTLAAWPQWDVEVLAPRRVPRSAGLLAGSLAVLIVTSYMLRPPATPHRLAASAPTQPAATAPDDAGAATQHPAGIAMSGDTGTGRGASSGHAQQALGHSPLARGGGQNGGGIEGGHASSPSAGSDANSQSSPGQLASASDRRMAAKADRQQQSSGATDPAARQDGKSATDAPADQRADSRPPGSAQAQNPRPADPRANTSPDKAARSPAGHGAGRGGRAGGGPQSDTGQEGTLFGEHGTGIANAARSENLALKLATFATSAPSGAEPQRRNDAALPNSAGARGFAQGAPLSDVLVPDAPLHKAEVSPEHEALIRRIFLRE